MILNVAAIAIVVAAAIVPVALTLLSKLRARRRRRRMKAAYVPRHLATGKLSTAGPDAWRLPGPGNFADEKEHADVS